MHSQDAANASSMPRTFDMAASDGREHKQPRTDLLELAWRLSRGLTTEDRRDLAARLLQTEAETMTFRRDGTLWTALAWDYTISHPLFIGKGFQAAEVRAVIAWMRHRGRLAPPHDVIVDIGANIGTTTIPFAQVSDCRIVAIEPVPDIFAVLCRNVADNDLTSRVTCVQAAISMAGGGQARMILPAGNSGGGEICRPDREASFAAIQRTRGIVDVPAVGLTDLLDAHGIAPERIAFVWSDSQGSETDVIKSGKVLWRAGAPLFTEFDPRTWGGSGGADALVAAATSHFTAFIEAEALKADTTVQPRPIGDLAAYCRALGPHGSDVLLLPTGFDRAPFPSVDA
jgi:FkbM family methyltransferase